GPTHADRARVLKAIAAAAPLAGLCTFAAASKASAGVLKSTLIFMAAVGVGSGVVISGAAIRRATVTPPPAPPPAVVHRAAPPAPRVEPEPVVEQVAPP